MSVYELVMQRRTVRRFEQRPVSREIMEKLLDAGRMAPSGGNLQPLEFIAVNNPEGCAAVFPHTRWAGYLRDWNPAPEEGPTAYVMIVHNQAASANAGQDPGIAAESITLVAEDEGLKSCMIGSLNVPALNELLGLPETHTLSLVMAVGYPAEDPMLEEGAGDYVKYWHDEAEVQHTPKRPREQVVHWGQWGGR